VKTSETTKAVLAALYAAQQKLKNITRDAENPHFRSTYATLEAVLDHVRPVLHEAGLVMLQTIGTGATGPVVTTRLWEVQSGEWIEDTLEIPAPSDAQKWGSAITYGRRYSIPPMLLIATEEDDDANAAGEKPRRSAAPAPKPTPQPAGKSGGDPQTVEGSVEAYSKRENPLGVKVNGDWYNTEDPDEIRQLKAAKADSHRVALDWTWNTSEVDGQQRKQKMITNLAVFDDNGEVIQG